MFKSGALFRTHKQTVLHIIGIGVGIGVSYGLFIPNVSVNAVMTLAILFSLKTMESLENGLQPHSGATPLFSMRTELQASLQH